MLTRATPVNETALVRFLLARVDDDEIELKKLARKQARDDETLVPTGPYPVERMRAECTSKRHLIGSIQQLLVLRDQPFEKAIRDTAIQMLHAMAAPYAGHHGYHPDWE